MIHDEETRLIVANRAEYLLPVSAAVEWEDQYPNPDAWEPGEMQVPPPAP